jgi:hypothetical protein
LFLKADTFPKANPYLKAVPTYFGMQTDSAQCQELPYQKLPGIINQSVALQSVALQIVITGSTTRSVDTKTQETRDLSNTVLIQHSIKQYQTAEQAVCIRSHFSIVRATAKEGKVKLKSFNHSIKSYQCRQSVGLFDLIHQSKTSMISIIILSGTQDAETQDNNIRY